MPSAYSREAKAAAAPHALQYGYVCGRTYRALQGTPLPIGVRTASQGPPEVSWIGTPRTRRHPGHSRTAGAPLSGLGAPSCEMKLLHSECVECGKHGLDAAGWVDGVRGCRGGCHAGVCRCVCKCAGMCARARTCMGGGSGGMGWGGGEGGTEGGTGAMPVGGTVRSIFLTTYSECGAAVPFGAGT